MYHYVYRITNTKENKHYYGVRSSKTEPKLDLGSVYLSSSSDKTFIQDQKENPQDYKYKILKIFKKREKANNFECFIHNKLSVDINESFYNKAKASGLQNVMLGKKHSEKTKEKMKYKKKISSYNINQLSDEKRAEMNKNNSKAKIKWYEEKGEEFKRQKGRKTGNSLKNTFNNMEKEKYKEFISKKSEKAKETYKNNPEIIYNRSKKLKEVYKTFSSEKRKQIESNKQKTRLKNKYPKYLLQYKNDQYLFFNYTEIKNFCVNNNMIYEPLLIRNDKKYNKVERENYKYNTIPTKIKNTIGWEIFKLERIKI